MKAHKMENELRKKHGKISQHSVEECREDSAHTQASPFGLRLNLRIS